MSKPIVKIIVGANYGDEGKGLATNFFCQSAQNLGVGCINVLHNGGPQRGHTVELPNGDRHVFHHFGSGTFAGAKTLFASTFMVDPIRFMEEYRLLKESFGIRPACQISNNCYVITPYDVFVNQIVEEHRADERHGSCGCGIWETQLRYQNTKWNRSYSELKVMSNSCLMEYLTEIATTYVPVKLREYGVQEVPESYQDLLDSEYLKINFIQDLRDMAKECYGLTANSLVNGKMLVFEGGQGLALDEDNNSMKPHVTASSTGSKNPLKMLHGIDCDIEICYVTRTYFTRHGAGPFPTECDRNAINEYIPIDETNQPNDFQGTLRYGRHDVEEMMTRIQSDRLKAIDTAGRITTSLMVTHHNYFTGFDIDDPAFGVFDKVYLSDTKFAKDIVIYR